MVSSRLEWDGQVGALGSIGGVAVVFSLEARCTVSEGRRTSMATPVSMVKAGTWGHLAARVR